MSHMISYMMSYISVMYLWSYYDYICDITLWYHMMISYIIVWYHTIISHYLKYDIICDIIFDIISLLGTASVDTQKDCDNSSRIYKVNLWLWCYGGSHSAETVFSHVTQDITYYITYDITNHDIIVGIVISLVICDIMFYNCCCQSEQQNQPPERAQRRARSWMKQYISCNTTFHNWYREVSSDGRAMLCNLETSGSISRLSTPVKDLCGWCGGLHISW